MRQRDGEALHTICNTLWWAGKKKIAAAGPIQGDGSQLRAQRSKRASHVQVRDPSPIPLSSAVSHSDVLVPLSIES